MQRTVAFCALVLGGLHLAGCEPAARGRLAALGVPATAEAVVASAKAGRTEALRLLLEAGEDANATDADAVAALAWAVVRTDAASVRLLTGAGADPTAPAGNDGMTELMLAAQMGARDIVEILTEAGAPPV